MCAIWNRCYVLFTMEPTHYTSHISTLIFIYLWLRLLANLTCLWYLLYNTIIALFTLLQASKYWPPMIEMVTREDLFSFHTISLHAIHTYLLGVFKPHVINYLSSVRACTCGFLHSLSCVLMIHLHWFSYMFMHQEFTITLIDTNMGVE